MCSVQLLCGRKLLLSLLNLIDFSQTMISVRGFALSSISLSSISLSSNTVGRVNLYNIVIMGGYVIVEFVGGGNTNNITLHFME